MKPYREFRPTGFDAAGLGCDEQQDWLVAPCGRNRDTIEGSLEDSNWHSLLKAIQAKDPEGTDHEVHRFGHWGPGWFELILVRPDTPAAKETQEIEDALANYPVVDDSDFSEREWLAACDQWRSMRYRDRTDYLRRHVSGLTYRERDKLAHRVTLPEQVDAGKFISP